MTAPRLLTLVAVALLGCATSQKTAPAPPLAPQARPAQEPAPLPPPPSAPPVILDEGAAYLRPEVADLREEAHDLVQQQSELAWKNWVSGEQIDLETTYKGHGDLFSSDALTTIRRIRADADGDASRALLNLELYVAGELLAASTEKLSDEASAITAGAVVSFGDVKLPYRDLDRTIAAEAVVGQRARMYAAEVAVLDKLNPVLERREAATDAAAKQLGFHSYAQLGGELRGSDPDSLVALAERTLTESEAIYAEAAGHLAMDDLALPLAKLHRSDIPRLFRDVSDETAFPGANLMSVAQRVFLGLGIDILQQKTLTIDSGPMSRKNPRTICIPIEVPTDIRLSVRPKGGPEGYRALFHELGHAELSLFTRRTEWEFQQLGNPTVREAYGFLMEGLIENPEWLGENTPLAGDRLAKFVRRVAIRRLFTLRHYAGRVLFEVKWHSGQLKEPPAEAWRKEMSRAFGFPLTADDAKRYLVDSDDFFGSADYLRAWLLSAQIERYLEAYYGNRWWESSKAGVFLRDLWADGNHPTADEVAKRVGVSGVATTALLERLASRLKR